MTNHPTVLVLGAGASRHLGFPTGPELLRNITHALGAVSSKDAPAGDRAFCDKLRSLGFTDADLTAFAEKLQRTGRSSVDAFLENQPDFVDLGKAAIACSLIPIEGSRPLNNAAHPVDRNWYQFLYNKFDSKDSLLRAKLTILTFNYDRSLEAYLRAVMQNDWNLSADEADSTLNSLPIIHLHGSLGDQAYGTPLKEVDLAISLDSIRIVSDANIEHQQFKLARQHIFDAERVCFLGLGYDKDNIQRLQIMNDWPADSKGALLQHPPPPPKYVSGTVFGLPEREIASLKSLFDVTTNFHPNWSDYDVLSFLENSRILED